MARTHIPLVCANRLLLRNAEENPSSIRVGTDDWYAWLANEQNKSFSFKNDLGGFTARRERQAHSERWYAYLRSGGMFRKAYLGRTQELTLERLNVVAATLNAQSNPVDTPHGVEPEEIVLPLQTISIGSKQASNSAYFCNLPLPLTSLIGREQELKKAAAILRRSEVRILTLTGPGGVGKTRMGLQIATNMKDDFTGGVCFVPLASVHDTDLVMPTIAQMLGLEDAREEPLSERLKDYLRQRHMLLLLDNFEQVVAAAPKLSELIAFCPALKILVTSRSALHIGGEHEFPVPPLALPKLKHLSQSISLEEYSAVALFIQRARAIKPDFHITDATASIVAEICTHLDGLPLAIELAAARIKLLPLPAMLARLEQGLQVLASGVRDAPARQQTLHNTIAWSYNLLNAQEQQLFRRLSIFVSGCGLEAVEALCIHFGDVAAPILDEVASLLDKSLLMQVEQENGELRLVQLQTVRDYGLEYLTASGELEIARQAHAEYYLALAERAELELFGGQQAVWLERLEREYDNFRAGLLYLVEQKETEAALRLGIALTGFWFMRGHLSEARRWLERAFTDSARVLPMVRARALSTAGLLCGLQGDFSRAEELCRESLSLLQSSGNSPYAVFTLWCLGWVVMQRSNFAEARELAEEALSKARGIGHKWSIALSLYSLGCAAFFQGKYDEACSLMQESLTLFKESGDVFLTAESLRRLADIFFSQGNDERAQTLIQESLALSRDLGVKWSVAWSLIVLAQIALHRSDVATALSSLDECLDLHKDEGDLQGVAMTYSLFARVLALQHDNRMARILYEESLTIARKLGDRWFIALYLEGLGEVLVDQGETAWAVQLWGSAETLREVIGAPMPPVERTRYERIQSIARSQLGEEDFAVAWAEGRAMTSEQALAVQGPVPISKQAISIPQVTIAAALSSIPPAGLTRREAEVLRLVARGLTNAEIAEQLVISPVTVNSYLRSIYSKLAVSSRIGAMRYAIDHNLL